MTIPIIDVLIMGASIIDVPTMGMPIKGRSIVGISNLGRETITRSFGAIRANE